MLKHGKLIAVGMIGLMVLTTFAIMSGPVVADARATGEPLPDWDLETMFFTRFDNTELRVWSWFGVIFQDAAGELFLTQLRLAPTDDAAWTSYEVVGKDASEYKMSLTAKRSQNGTWAAVVIDLDYDGNGVDSTEVTMGQEKDSGTYTFRLKAEGGSVWYDVKNLGFKRGISTVILDVDFSGSMEFQVDIRDDMVEGTDKPMNSLKTDWGQGTMDVGQTWKMNSAYEATIDNALRVQGDVTSGGQQKTQVVRTRDYNFDYTVASKADHTVNNIEGGGNCRFVDAYKVTRTGYYDWTVNDDGGTSNSGRITNNDYYFWYGADGDKFDGGWIVDYNGTTRMTWSTYISFTNTAPELTGPPPATVDVMEDELWEFVHGIDYTVTDEDPGIAGELEFEIAAELGTSAALSGMEINIDTGDISYTPTQTDVADGYEITITISDKYDKGALSTTAEFILNIKNANDGPTADSTVMVNFEMNEGESKTPTWTLADVFSDPDMDPNPLNANAPYDPQEKLTYSVSNNGSIRLLCPNGQDLTSTNQCDAISFEAMDGDFPRDLPMAMTITATDKGSLKTNDQVTIIVKHVNHKPTVLGDAPDEFEMDEDTTSTVLLQDIFEDIDVGNLAYPTADSLNYDKDGEKNLKITITGSKAKIEPDEDWNGEEEVTFEASDKSGAKASHDLNIEVTPVNDDPVPETLTPSTDPTIDEMDDGTQDGSPTEQIFSVVASDVDGDILSFNWSIEDGDTGDVYLITSHDAEYIFETAFDGDFEDGAFHGGEGTKTYIVSCTVTDGIVDVEARTWFVTVRNVNRNPLVDGVDIFEVKKSGEEIPLSPKSPGVYAFKFGKVYKMDVTNFVTDHDEGIDRGTGIENIDQLQFDWTTSIQQTIGAAETVAVSAGKGSTLAEFKLKAGKTHQITVRVADQDGGSADHTFSIKVQADPNSGVPGFEAVMFVAAVGVAVAVLAYRKKR